MTFVFLETRQTVLINTNSSTITTQQQADFDKGNVVLVTDHEDNKYKIEFKIQLGPCKIFYRS